MGMGIGTGPSALSTGAKGMPAAEIPTPQSCWSEILFRSQAVLEAGIGTAEKMAELRDHILPSEPTPSPNEAQPSPGPNFKDQMLGNLQGIMDEFNKISRHLEQLQ